MKKDNLPSVLRASNIIPGPFTRILDHGVERNTCSFPGGNGVKSSPSYFQNDTSTNSRTVSATVSMMHAEDASVQTLVVPRWMAKGRSGTCPNGAQRSGAVNADNVTDVGGRPTCRDFVVEVRVAGRYDRDPTVLARVAEGKPTKCLTTDARSGIVVIRKRRMV